jgi:hypothetical protein
MKKIFIRESWVQYAKQNYSGDKYNQNTLLPAGRGQFAGIIGECAVGRYFLDAGIDFDYDARKSYDYDFIVGGYKIDVKSKFSKGEPQPHYTVRIPEYQKNQECDLYIFTYVTDSAVYLLGYMQKDEFWETATFAGKGVTNVTFIERVDCHFIEVEKLHPIENLEIKFIEY